MSGNGLVALQKWGITVLRVVVGIVFLMHGGQKLFIWGIGNVAGTMEGAGIPMPMLAAVVVTGVEFLGGFTLLVGFLTRWAAIPLAMDMVGAILTVHLQGGFFLPNGFEFALTLLAANLSLALLGSGEASIDRFLEMRNL